MKRLMISLILAATFIYADAGNRCDWKEKMMSERVAFLTLEMNLTPEEIVAREAAALAKLRRT